MAGTSRAGDHRRVPLAVAGPAFVVAPPSALHLLGLAGPPCVVLAKGGLQALLALVVEAPAADGTRGRLQVGEALGAQDRRRHAGREGGEAKREIEPVAIAAE